MDPIPAPARRLEIPPRFTLLAIVLCAFASTGCQSTTPSPALVRAGAGVRSLLPPAVSTTPDELTPRCHQNTVRRRMGRPTEIERWQTVRGTVVGEVWHYRDYWWSADRGRGQNFASWAVYIDHDKRFAGWRLNSPLAQAPDARERFFVERPPMVQIGIDPGSGVRVADVVDCSPATRVELKYIKKRKDGTEVEKTLRDKGLKENDSVLSLNGTRPRDKDDLLRILSGMQQGTPYPIEIKRGGKSYYGVIVPAAALLSNLPPGSS